MTHANGRTAVILFTLTAIAATMLAGCGGGSPNAPAPPADTVKITARYDFTGVPTALVPDADHHYSGEVGYYDFDTTEVHAEGGTVNPVTVREGKTDKVIVRPVGKGYALQAGEYELTASGCSPWYLFVSEREHNGKTMRIVLKYDDGTECYRNADGVYEMDLNVPFNLVAEWYDGKGNRTTAPDGSYGSGYYTVVGTAGFEITRTFGLKATRGGEGVFSMYAGDYHAPDWIAVVAVTVGRG